MSTRDIVLSHPVRTAIGAYNGTLKNVPATELGAIVVRETLRRAGFGGDEIAAVVMGNVIQAGNRMNPARQASIGGGLPVSVPAMTVNRVCGSGAQAILNRCTGDRGRRQRRRHCRRHGEHGPRAVSDG
jgi:acetyl-CoA C-acetyltransferase